ncbi:MAG TPA: NAD-dependent epimerase/dehydratase family protein, partial [Niastella sp.]
MKIKVIITGASGMVGEGVLHECLLHPDVEEVLVVGRRTAGVVHPKLKEIIHKDFFDLSPIKDQLKGYNACYFCLGVSSVGMKEKEYHHLTYDLTMHMATILADQNPGMTFCYVSGSGTDSSEHGKLMWARVKGQTENDLMRLPFKAAYMF